MRAEASSFLKKMARNPWALFAVTAVAMGAFIRICGMSHQIPMDDEWHGIFAAGTKTIGYLATHLSVAGTSIPYSLYLRSCLMTVGWNEVILRLPALVAGLACLVVCPLTVRRLFKVRAAALYTFFLAISPLLIFYSRYSRSYSITVLFQFTALFSFYSWLTTGNRKDRLLFIVSIVLAIWFHCFAISLFLACLLFTCAVKSPFLMSIVGCDSRLAAVGWRQVLGVFFTVVVLLTVLYGPTFLNGSFSEAMLWRVQPSLPGPESFFEMLILMSGTGRTAVLVIMAELGLLGSITVLRAQRPLALLFLSCLLVSGLCLFSAWRENVTGFAATRWAIILVPIYLLVVALGLEKLFLAVKEAAPRLGWGQKTFPATVVLFAVMAFLVSGTPLVSIYAGVNDFTNHNAFQQDYRNIQRGAWYRDLAYPFDLAEENIPDFYRNLRLEEGAFSILEYPMVIGWHFNCQYYYQHLHGKHVLAGFVSFLRFVDERLQPTMVFGDGFFDFYLMDIRCPGKLRFRTIIDMLDIDGMRKAGVRYIVLHNDILRETFNRPGRIILSDDPFFVQLKDFYSRHFGAPVYADNWIIVFRTRREPDGSLK